MVGFWAFMCGFLWLAGGWVLWDHLSPLYRIAVLIAGVALQLFFVESLSSARGAGLPARFREWLGVGASALVGAMVGILATRSLLFFRESWEMPLTALGALAGVLTVGVVYLLGMHRRDQKARDQTLSGLLIGIFVVSLTVFVLARLSLATTQPDWLFRFPRNKEVRVLWGSTEWVALLLAVWAGGAACLARLVKGVRGDRRRV